MKYGNSKHIPGAFSLSAANDVRQQAITNYINQGGEPGEPPAGDYTFIPGVYGFGTDTRGPFETTSTPTILHVDTLSAGSVNTDSTHGSLKWCLEQNFPRIIVFDVAGIIDGMGITPTNGYCWIAGQSAPKPVALTRTLKFFGDHMIMQHIAIRNQNSADNIDCSGSNYYNGGHHHLLWDHVSMSWATDENFDLWVGADNDNTLINHCTMANCILQQGIKDHSCGSLNTATEVSFLGNIYAHNHNRNPWTTSGADLVFFNNVVYNWEWRSMQIIGDYSYTRTARIDYRGNYVKAGPNSGSNSNVGIMSFGSFGDDKAYIYMTDNIKNGTTLSGFDYTGTPPANSDWQRSSTPFDLPAGCEPYPASETLDKVLANAGSWPAQRDSADAQLITDIPNGDGTTISSIPSMPHYDTVTDAFVPVSDPFSMYDDKYTRIERQLHACAYYAEHGEWPNWGFDRKGNTL